jgi:predicted DNA-binding protein with PD1-like motif
LDSFVLERQIEAACVVTCVGSLQKAVLRYANQGVATEIEGKFEIVSLTGTLSTHGSHYHISISDGEGQTLGGHLLEGCLIYTTAEIVLAEFPSLKFLREHCSESGYEELVVQSDG